MVGDDISVRLVKAKLEFSRELNEFKTSKSRLIRSESELIESYNNLQINEHRKDIEEALKKDDIGIMINESLPPEERDELPKSKKSNKQSSLDDDLDIQSLNSMDYNKLELVGEGQWGIVRIYRPHNGLKFALKKVEVNLQESDLKELH
jgi:hypothetical protein